MLESARLHRIGMEGSCDRTPPLCVVGSLPTSELRLGKSTGKSTEKFSPSQGRSPFFDLFSIDLSQIRSFMTIAQIKRIRIAMNAKKPS